MDRQTNPAASQEFEMLKRLGAKWAVLTAMATTMLHKQSKLPVEVIEALKTARLKISSGCFSPCEITCELSKAEGGIFAQCHLLNPEEVEHWSNLLAEAMQGKLDYERIQGIPALSPVKSDCAFLRCTCSDSH